MTILKIRLTIDLIVDPDIIREVYDIRTSTIYDISGKKIIIAQTEPRLSTPELNKGIIVSFLTHEKDIPTRYGFQAKIINFIEEYRLFSSQIEPAIVIEQNTIPKHYNLRRYYRISPPDNSGLHIYTYGQPVVLADISLGGALVGITVNQDLEFMFEVGQIVKITLTIDNENYDLKAEIKRISYPEKPGQSQNLGMMACEFRNRTPEFDQALEKKLIHIQRELRFKMV
jgi:PilZ domain